jgi:hypothetical protein
MPSTGRKLELKANTSVAQTGSQPAVYAKGLRQYVPPEHSRPTFTAHSELLQEKQFGFKTDFYAFMVQLLRS